MWILVEGRYRTPVGPVNGQRDLTDQSVRIGRIGLGVPDVKVEGVEDTAATDPPWATCLAALTHPHVRHCC
jgi:hypothetical protein